MGGLDDQPIIKPFPLPSQTKDIANPQHIANNEDRARAGRFGGKSGS